MPTRPPVKPLQARLLVPVMCVLERRPELVALVANAGAGRCPWAALPSHRGIEALPSRRNRHNPPLEFI